MERIQASLWKAGAALLALACLAALLPPAALAQAAGGTLFGRVTDGSGGALPGATVTATNPDTGYDRVGVTIEDGSFRLTALPAGDYDVRVELSGFAPVIVENVRVSVASQRSIEVTLQAATVEESITVVDEAPLVASEPSIGTVVSQQELENLPLNGRQFANLAALAPGTTLSVNADPTKPGQLTIALGGGIGRNVNYIMDGGDNTDDTIGGALQNFNLEAVQEFKIQTQQYKAEYGRSSGGVLTVVTKTGTNEFGGSVYGFFRDDGLAEKTETEKLAGLDKGKLEREQWGGSIGGPIVKDRAHFFATYEKTDRTTEYTVFTGGVFPTFDGTVVPLPFEDELITAKATYDVNPKNFLQVRYGSQENADKYGASPLAAPTGLGTLVNEYESLLAGWNTQLGGEMLNEFLFQYTSFDNSIAADSNDPFIIYPSGFFTGQNINTPQSTHQRKRQWKDDFSFTQSIAGDRHDFKVGVNYIDEYSLGGDFTVGTAGQYSASEDRLGSPIIVIEVAGGFAGNETPIEQQSAYVQDDWAVTDRLTVNVGLRYDYFTGFDLDQRTNPLYQVLHSQTKYNEYYLADFRSFDGVLDEDDDNLAPRLGFSYDVKGDGRHLVRGGYGTYFDFPYTNATILFPAIQVQSLSGVIYRHADPNGIRNPNGTLFQPGQPLCIGSVTTNCLPNQLPSSELGSGSDEIASPTLATPYSDQISLGYSWQVNNWLGLNFELLSVDYHDIPYRFRPNVIDPTTGKSRFPQFGNFRIWYGGGRASYDGANIGFRVRQDKFEMQGFYTYSEAEGNVLAGADEFRLTDAGAQADVGGGRNRRDQSINPLDPQCGRCFGPLYTDSKHRFTLGGIYHGPWGVNVSGMFRYRSALPYLEHANTDLNGDGSIIDLRPGVSGVNTGRGDDFSQLDVRLAKEFSFTDDFSVEIIGEVFNVFDEKNPTRPNRFGVPSAFAGDPLQGEQRLAQLGARIRF